MKKKGHGTTNEKKSFTRIVIHSRLPHLLYAPLVLWVNALVKNMSPLCHKKDNWIQWIWCLVWVQWRDTSEWFILKLSPYICWHLLTFYALSSFSRLNVITYRQRKCEEIQESAKCRFPSDFETFVDDEKQKIVDEHIHIVAQIKKIYAESSSM